MKIIFSLFGATLAATVLVLNLVTAEEGQMPEFTEVDSDQNGLLNTEEAAAVPQLASIFDGADVDKDGMLNPNEYDRAKRHIESKS